MAIQIKAECDKFGSVVDCNAVCLYGGAPLSEQQRELKKLQPVIVVGTPGRLVDLLEKKAFSLSQCSIVVLDEADRMLDMGFEPQIKVIFENLPKIRQTLFFTATWPKSVRKLAATFLREGQTKEIFVGTGEDAELEANKAVSQLFIHATDDEKDKKLFELLTSFAVGSKVVVFANTKRRVEYLYKQFW